MSAVDVALRLVAGLAVGAALLWIHRWIRDQSPLLGTMVAAGLLLRASLGLLLFWVSYLDLPLWRSLHTGDGFWRVAPDARWYAVWATTAASEGLDLLHSGGASPTYVKLLAVWMRLVGAGPAAGMFLNLLLYGLLCGLVVLVWRPRGDWREDLPCIVLLGSFTLSPALLIHGTQPLKDDAFAFLIAVACVGVFLLLGPAIYGRRSAVPVWAAALGLGMLWLAVFSMGGIRAYYAFLLWGALTGIFALFSVRWNLERLRRSLPVGMAVCILLWFAYVMGAGAYAHPAVTLMSRVTSWAEMSDDQDSRPLVVLREALGWVQAARVGFVRAGGATNVVLPPDVPVSLEDVAAPVAGRARVRRMLLGELALAGDDASPLARVAVGLTTLFVPVSLLQALSVARFPGGRNLLFITDIDTLFVNFTIFVSLVLLYRRWDTVRQHLPYVCFVILLAGVTAVLLGYVVTNFGTIFRLRVLVAVPIWMLTLAASPHWAARDAA